MAGRERVLGPDHPDTQTSRKNLAKAYQDAGRAAEAIPLLERTLAGRQRVLRSDHPDTQTSRKNLATAYRDGDRALSDPASRADLGRRRVRHLPMPPRKCFRPASVGLPPIRPGGCFRPASVGLPPIRPGGCFLTVSQARLPS